jgi:predicted ATPase/DNA-binding winged helix-turn-helix (wHTH) protein
VDCCYTLRSALPSQVQLVAVSRGTSIAGTSGESSFPIDMQGEQFATGTTIQDPSYWCGFQAELSDLAYSRRDQGMQTRNQTEPQVNDIISFGPFKLNLKQRRLEKGGTPLRLGSRAFDILAVLVERAGTLVSKSDLMDRVWSDVAVDEGCLRVHIASLRKALGDCEAGARYVTTLSGRGYCFVAPISRSSAKVPTNGERRVDDGSCKLPNCQARTVGRDEAIQQLSAQLVAGRFVSVVGTGGIGKTTVALSVGHRLVEDFAGAVCLVDLGSVNDSLLVPGAVASALGLCIKTDDPTPDLINCLQDRRMLLILDNCEHVIETAAALAERLFIEAPQVYLLATSREPLRVKGEFVYRLPPLGSPPAEAGLSAMRALDFPAVQLFVERVAASGNGFELSDADAAVVGEICRRLDGIALAIELAAGCVNAWGLQETLEIPTDRFNLLRTGRRTAPPRHKTLSAMLDWSYDLLSEPERLILRRLSTFSSAFTLEDAIAVAADEGVDDTQVIDGLASLVNKSLVAVTPFEGTTNYGLLNAIRSYASRKLVEAGEADAIKRRHAVCCRELLERAPPSDGVSVECFDSARARLEVKFLGEQRSRARYWVAANSC